MPVDAWTELWELLAGLGPGQGVELPSSMTRNEVAYRLRLAFPGYLLVTREGHTFVLRPLDVEAPADGGLGLYGRARVRDEKIAKLLASGKIRKLDDLGKELGVSAERARQLLKRLGLTFPRGGYVEVGCAQCGARLLLTASQALRVKSPICSSCIARRNEVVSLTCLRCKEPFELKRVEAEALAAPFCPACWRGLSRAEQQSWQPPKRPRQRATGPKRVSVTSTKP